MYTEYVIHKFDIEKQSNADDNYRKNAAMYAQWRDLTSKAKVICAELDLDSEDNHFADMESVISLAASVDEYVDSVEDRTYAGEIVDIIDAINADKLDEAEELLNAQIAQGYAQSDTYCYLGKIAMLRGNLSEAEEKLLYSLEIKKDDIWTIGQLIQLYRRLDNDNEALKYSMLGSELGSHFCIEVAMQLLKKLKGTNEAIKHGEKYIDAVRQSRECIGVLSTQYGEKLIALDLLKAENRQLAEELISKITELNAYYKMVDFTVYTDDDAAKIRSACDEMVEANLLVVKNVQEECIEREKRSIVWRLVLVGIIWIAIGVLLILLGAYIGILAVLIGGLIIASSYAKNAHVYAAEEKGKKYGAFRAIINLLFRGKK